MKKIMLTVLILLFGFSIINAQNNSEDLLKNVQEKFKSLNDFSADLIYKRGSKSDASGKILYKKDNKFRLELSNLTLIYDGETAWNYNKKDSKVIISSAEEDDSGPTIFNIEKIIQDYPAKSNVKIDDDMITLTPKEAGAEFDVIKLWINKDNFVYKAEISQPGGAMNVELKNIKLDQNISDSRFSFNPPEGTKVIDLR